MSRNTKISAALIAAFVLVAAIVVAVSAGGSGEDRSSTPAPSSGASTTESGERTRVVAPDPRRLGRPGTSGVTFTEFLDFECEACGAAYPSIEQLRQEYAGRVTFNIRYFPLESHSNARNAAIAVEAAAQQGELEGMYKRMYETQRSWGEKQTSKAALFRQFAEDLGLDMKAYDAAVADPKTDARVERDVKAGLALGVQSTPTFFINEQRIEPQSVDDIRAQLDAALGDT